MGIGKEDQRVGLQIRGWLAGTKTVERTEAEREEATKMRQEGVKAQPWKESRRDEGGNGKEQKDQE